jgi:hypothetical protein
MSALTPDVSEDQSPGTPPGDPGDAVRVAALEVEVRMLRDQLSDTRADRDRLAALLKQALETRPGLIERLARLVRV